MPACHPHRRPESRWSSSSDGNWVTCSSRESPRGEKRRRIGDITMPDRIRIRTGGSESTFSAPGPVVLGRDSSDIDVQLDHGAVSRRHAQLAHDGQGWVLADLDSSNGTWVNGSRINGPHRVTSATTIRLGMQQQGADITVEPISENVTTPTADPPTSL